jgi:hypothetical protein
VRTISLLGKGSHWLTRMPTIKKVADAITAGRRAKEPMIGDDFQPGSPTESGRN